MSNEKLEELANQIWNNKEYKEALDILYEYKPDLQEKVRERVMNILEGKTEDKSLNKIKNYVSLEDSSKAYIRFSDKVFDNY